ncbi:MAG: peptide-methionine (S)-S-oxide reductase MsrA [Sphingomicrobium sp.]
MTKIEFRALALLSVLFAMPVSAASARTETAILAGGCFWGVEGVFEHVKGVRDVVSGYAGGSRRDANYTAVSSERTGHAEAVKITYDPSVISYAQLLRIYATVAHDPGQLNRQGPDVGVSYRSAIFPQDARQKQVAQQFLAQLSKSRRVVTRIEAGPFYAAEASHQDFLRRNPRHPYIIRHDLPKLAELKREYPQYWRS